MSRYYGTVGYASWVEESPDEWVEKIVERKYYGDYLNVGVRTVETDNLNDNIQIENSLSIVADPYAYENFAFMRYATIGSVKWKISSVTVERPRLILSLGGIYHEQSNKNGGEAEDRSRSEESILSSSSEC